MTGHSNFGGIGLLPRHAVITATALLLGVAPSIHAQAAAPDSSSRRLFIETILASSDPRIARAQGDTVTRIFRVFYRTADSLRWRAYTDEILKRLNSRLMTDQDLQAKELTITDLRITGDTLIGKFGVGERQRCPTEPWMGGATMYEMRALRAGRGWAKPSIRVTGIGDTRRCA